MIKVPDKAEAIARWVENVERWAWEHAATGQLAEPLPSPLWVFAPDLRKISVRSRETATITLGRSHLRHLGVQIGEYIRIIRHKDGSLTLRKATAKDLRQANPYTKLNLVPSKRSKERVS